MLASCQIKICHLPTLLLNYCQILASLILTLIQWCLHTVS